MGNYIQIQDLEDRLTLPVLENLSGKHSNDLTKLLEQIIARAEAFVNNYACIRYAVPLPEDPLITEWTLRIAEYELYKRGPGTNVPEKIRESYKECIIFLNDLAQGKFHLASDPAKKPGQGSSFIIEPAGEEKNSLFSADTMRDF
ncbi:MAG: DUF1320 domain-containing protein [Lentisphaeria bacterium]|nr:DUF1320 domain-containing protein [Lentisphaeria bacterium]